MASGGGDGELEADGVTDDEGEGLEVVGTGGNVGETGLLGEHHLVEEDLAQVVRGVGGVGHVLGTRITGQVGVVAGLGDSGDLGHQVVPGLALGGVAADVAEVVQELQLIVEQVDAVVGVEELQGEVTHEIVGNQHLVVGEGAGSVGTGDGVNGQVVVHHRVGRVQLGPGSQVDLVLDVRVGFVLDIVRVGLELEHILHGIQGDLEHSGGGGVEDNDVGGVDGTADVHGDTAGEGVKNKVNHFCWGKMRKGRGAEGGKQRTYILLKHYKNHGNYNCDYRKYSFDIFDGNNVFRGCGRRPKNRLY